MEIEIGIITQMVVGAATVAGAYATTRTQSAQHSRGIQDANKRIVSLEKAGTALLSRKEAAEHYVTKIEFSMTMKNVDLKLDHIDKSQAEILAILKNRGKA